MNYFAIDLIQQLHKAPVQYPTLHNFLTEMSTCVHISVMNHIYLHNNDDNKSTIVIIFE